ncbi:MAG: Asp-tRNA(Asn)/Glu-tRNA(Gln) amidotransferase subunit GatB [Ruminococcaceae bacterium]|nr:Asp-tRNA(Asn)/Glu-tRNA(Gln) amidotransferase subunit GatB [Oscillospiraceae bacterium]
MSDGYETVIGLEIHAELSTESKIFCGCQNAFGAAPNTLCCPVCTGLPGALPVLNAQVVEYAVKMGLALGCHINTLSWMDRKHYFYPDLPKAYQISQNDRPLCETGQLQYLVGGQPRHLGITRIHIEEDAGKLLHDAATDTTLIDYNRCGVPLIEIVTEPDLRSADEAKAAMEEITRILLALGISDARMQEGSIRADVNVSVRPKGQAAYGVRNELKNINSFGAVHRAIVHEAARQRQILAKGGVIGQETRRWNDLEKTSVVLRTKEETHDYRFFPEPDLPPFEVPEKTIMALSAQIPELPATKTLRYQQAYALPPDDALLLAGRKPFADFFEAAVALRKAAPRQLANWLLGDVSKLLNEHRAELGDTRLTPDKLVTLVEAIDAGTISGTAGKQVLEHIISKDTSVETAIEMLGLKQVSDAETLNTLVNSVIRENPAAVADWRAGKKQAQGFLLGRCIKASGGRANPQVTASLLRQVLDDICE